MLLPTFLVAICATVLPASAHYSLSYPPPRGTNEDNQGSGPCGGFDEPSSNRTVMSTTALTVQLEMGHDEAAVQVLLGFGDNPGNNFNLTIVRTMRQEGLGEFCIPDIPLPTDLGIRNGTNATLQVVTNGDPTGGLYSVMISEPHLRALC